MDYNSVPLPTQISGTESAVCVGVLSGGTCWNDYLYNSDVVLWKRRTGSIWGGSTSVNDILKFYVPILPLDPLPTRGVGNTYIISTSPGDIHCDGSQTVWGGGWIYWQPEIVNPTNDKSCLGQGEWGCCSGIGCGQPNFCLTRVDI